MKITMLEVRDEGTCIPVIAYRMSPDNTMQQRLLARCGYGSQVAGQSEFVWLQRLDGGEGAGTSDVYKSQGRTMHEAHKYIKTHIDELNDGDVIDVEFILGECNIKKLSEVQ